MKTREAHLEEQESENPMHANWPLVRITAYMLLGGILMVIILKASPPDNQSAKPYIVQTKPCR